jgi:hypothetical protein
VNAYISRVFEKCDDFSLRYWLERVYDSYDKALYHLKDVFFDTEVAEPSKFTYGEIVSQLNGGAEIRSTYYDSFGKVISETQTEPFVERKDIYVTPDFKPQYKLGDIVIMGRDKQLFNEWIGIDETIGVIATLPPKLEDFNPETDWKGDLEAVYEVDYIWRGYYTHDHLYEYEMRPFTGELPREQTFLQVLSRHYRGEEVIPEDKLAAIIKSDIYLRPVKTLREIGIELPIASDAALYDENTAAVYVQGEGLCLWTFAGEDKILWGHTLIHRLPDFDITKDIKVYCHAPYIVCVENHGTHGMVYNREAHKRYTINRGDGHVEHCSWAIGFVERDGETLLIHATDWNRLDITRLRDFELLTPRELTEENSIDYFHSRLTVSPDGKHFAVDGWVWSPSESILIYDVDRFFTEYDKAYTMLDMPEPLSNYNWDRPLCWVDDHTVAIGYNPNEGETEAAQVPSQIILYDISQTKTYKRQIEYTDGRIEPLDPATVYPQSGMIPFDGFSMTADKLGGPYWEARGELYYDSTKGWFISLNDQNVLVAGREGHIYAPHFKGWRYSPEFRRFYKFSPEPYEVAVKTLDESVKIMGR